MCGIAGILNSADTSVPLDTLEKMAQAIAHRGPDGEGFFRHGTVGLCHRRLAILDLSAAGHQPMSSPDGRWVISYNGEIYNFKELRQELEKLGHQFHSGTDTEVVLAAWAAWGEKSLERFNGMFAFAIYDCERRELSLARDRYGIKPLYYAFYRGTFVFGSEIKAILASGILSARLDLPALLEYFTFQNFFTDRTLFSDVRLLPAGNWLRVSSGESLRLQVARYWDFDFAEPVQPRDEREYVEELNRLFRQAVKRQLVSDVEVGTYLSGGMDSGSIAAVAARELPYVKSFTCGFDLHSASGLELGMDEREAAEHMSYLFKTEHYEMVLKAGDMERVLPRLVRHLEEPRVGQSYPNFYAARLASKFVKVVLSGAGGDEVFGGYPWRYYRAAVNDDFEHYIDKYYSYWQRLIPNAVIQRIFQPVWPAVQHVWTRDIFRDVFLHHPQQLDRPEDYINQSLYFEAKTFLHGLLIVEDKLSMAHGLEARLPFLDNDLVDFAQKIPVRLKLGNLGEVIRLNENSPGDKTAKYFQQTQDGKLILRRAMESLVPKHVTQRIKQGFSAPDSSWFKGDSIEYVRRTLYSTNTRLWQYLDRDETLALVNEHMSGHVNRRLLIWSLLNVESLLTQMFA
jgi:asparagine synthase (glutamine-hydrolysing)